MKKELLSKVEPELRNLESSLFVHIAKLRKLVQKTPSVWLTYLTDHLIRRVVWV